MRILQLINSLEKGGAERLVLDLHTRYLQRGHESVLLAFSGARAGRVGDGVHSLGFTTPYSPSVLPALTDDVDLPALAGFHVLHSHLFPSQLVLAVLGEFVSLEGALVTTEHSTGNRRRGNAALRSLDRWFYRKYHRIVCVSRASAGSLAEWLPELDSRIEVIHNGIDHGRFNRDRRQAHRRCTTILSVGRLTEAKNYHRAIEAFSMLCGSCDDRLLYVIAGGGALGPALKRHACKMGVSGRVVFPGEVDDVRPLLENADIFFMPSSREGFGIAAVEAMASGLPVVASRLPGIGDVVGGDGECGILIDPDSPSGMADALLKMVGDDLLRRRMADAAVVRSSFFSIDRTASEYLQLYERILGGDIS